MRPETRSAIARIDTLENGTRKVCGTGFLVAKGIVLTALHVVAEREANPPHFYEGTISLQFSNSVKNKQVFETKATVIGDCWDQSGDWVLLKCEKKIRIEPIPLALLNQDKGHWETWGFPQTNGVTLEGEVSAIHENWQNLGVGVLELFGKQAAAGRGAHVRGWSGSPVIINDQAVGLLRTAWQDSEGRSEYGALYATSIAEVAKRCRGRLPELRKIDRKDLFAAEYRHRLEAKHDLWDLKSVGGRQLGSRTGQGPSYLDDMYLPLRFASSADFENLGKGTPLDPNTLLKRERPLAIKGMAGSGKTTWIRWTYRRLMREPRAFPIMVELRKLARSWNLATTVGRDRSLFGHLIDLIAEIDLGEYEKELTQILKEPPPDLTPVLLVDGWDELGNLGEELRERLLTFRKSNPKVIVVVTSRPYGNARPSHSDNFDELDVQPLSDSDVRAFASKFYQRYPADSPSNDPNNFQAQLKRSPEARNLTRTPLLLTMMLVVSRSGGLSEKRHKLYERCIEILLATVPDQKEREGAVMPSEQFRPEDEHKRFTVVAKLAFDVQNAGYRFAPTMSGSRRSRYRPGADRELIVQSSDDLAALLPESWKVKRGQFLNWLIERAGLLADRSDGTINFAHLSFQEFLSAWHLNVTCKNGDNITETFLSRIHDTKWWETLRLWAAIIENRDSRQLEQILFALMNTSHTGFWLAGTIFAEGLGEDAVADIWIQRCASVLSEGWDRATELCMASIAGSSQVERRKELAARLKAEAPNASWIGRLRLDHFVYNSSLKIKLRPPDKRSNTGLMTDFRGIDHPRQLALYRARFFVPRDLHVANENKDWPWLSLWPSQRARVGNRLQSLASLPVSRDEVLAVARNSLKQDRDNHQDSVFAVDCARDLQRLLPRDLAQEWAHYLSEDWPRHSTHPWACDLVLALARGWGEGWHSAGPDAASFETRWEDFVVFGLDRDWAREAAKDWAITLGVKAENLVVANQFGALELSAFRRMSGRAVACYRSRSSNIGELILAACELSMHPRSSARGRFTKILKEHAKQADPMWLALSRYLARQPDSGDRTLLEQLAANPDSRNGDLAAALKYFVRGDVVLNDGTEVTLDEMCDELNVSHLPYLDELPAELILDRS